MKPTTSFRYLLLAACGFVGVSCAKNDDGADPADLLAGTRWQASLIDENPASNPPGEFRYAGNHDFNTKHQYYPWQECQRDDTFAFKNGKMAVDNNGTPCLNELDLIFEFANQPYVYDEEAKKLTVGVGEDSVTFDVYELNKSRFKMGLTVPTAGGFKYVVFLFKSR